MVQTRSQNPRIARINNYIGLRRHRYRKRYRPNDVSHRHRLPDRQRKSVHVISYYRRN